MKHEMQIENWIDFMEGELEPSLREDYARVLAHSKEDAALLGDLSKLRNSLKKADALKIKPDFNSDLFDKIMLEIQSTSQTPKWRLRLTEPSFVKQLAASIVFILLTGVILWELRLHSLNERHVTQTNDQEFLLRESAHNPVLLAQAVNANQSEADFVLDSLAYKMADFKDEELIQVFDEVLK